MIRFLVDTDIVVDFLRGLAESVRFVRRYEAEMALSAVTVAELYAGVGNETEAAELDDFLALFPILSVDTHTARLAGVLKKQYGKSHGTGLADGLIAATAQVHHLDLRTRNTRHYPMFRGLKPAYERSSTNTQS